jgi:hypothetical protein
MRLKRELAKKLKEHAGLSVQARNVQEYREFKQRWGPEKLEMQKQASLLYLHQLFLPTNGLSEIRPILEGEGFYFQEYGQNYIAALFPRGWQLEMGNLPEEIGVAYLVGPSKRRRAKIVINERLDAYLHVL